MKKFEFRLQRLLWYHQQRQKQADVKLQQAAWQRELGIADVNSVLQQIEQACRLKEGVGLTVDISARQNATLHLEALARTLTTAREKLKSMEERLREAREARAKITRDVEGLLHLRSQQQLEHRDEIARQQQIVIDEVVMRQWSMGNEDATVDSFSDGD